MNPSDQILKEAFGLPSGCGKPHHNGSELERRGYNDAKSAAEGHLEMCKKYAKGTQ